jgi:hypothetical protein
VKKNVKQDNNDKNNTNKRSNLKLNIVQVCTSSSVRNAWEEVGNEFGTDDMFIIYN